VIGMVSPEHTDDPVTSRLVLLGTAGGPTPKVERSAPAQAVVVNGDIYLVDAGNGVGRQLVRAGLDINRLRVVAVTHHHSDHVADVGTVLLLAWGTGLTSAVRVIGPKPLRKMIESYLDFADVDVRTRVADEARPGPEGLIDVHELSGDGLVYEDENVRISTCLVNHPPMVAYAYRIDAPDRSYVFSGDTTPNDDLIALAKGADILVHEVMHLPSIDSLIEAAGAPKGLRSHLINSHTSTADVGRIARKAGVGKLVLNHLIPTDGGPSDEVWTQEAKQDFSGEVVLGDDLMEL
jgi:ribonuclease BN (tRNA processing enzyme)